MIGCINIKLTTSEALKLMNPGNMTKSLQNTKEGVHKYNVHEISVEISFCAGEWVYVVEIRGDCVNDEYS